MPLGGFQVIEDGLKLNGPHQLLVYFDDVNILGGSVQKKKKKLDALVVASNKIGLKVNAIKTKYMVMSQDQNDNSSFGRMELLKYLGTTPTKSKFYSGRN
jgi:hypothetical protein